MMIWHCHITPFLIAGTVLYPAVAGLWWLLLGDEVQIRSLGDFVRHTLVLALWPLAFAAVCIWTVCEAYDDWRDGRRRRRRADG